MTEQAAPPLRTWRPMAAWTAGIVCMGALSATVAYLLCPYLEGRRAAEEWRCMGIMTVQREASAAQAIIARLGGPEAAARKLALYTKGPGSSAGERESDALDLMVHCGQSAYPHMAALLKEGGATARAIVVLKLGRMDGADTIALLSGALDDPDHQVRCNAIDALGHTTNPHASLAVGRLAAMLTESVDPFDRQGAAWALGQIGGDQARSALRAFAQDPDASVRAEVAEALKEIRGEEKK